MYTLFADTDCDMTPKLAKEHGFKLISMPYSIDGKTIYPYEDFEEFKSKEFYDMLRGGVTPTTSAIGIDKYKAYFEPEFAAGNDILYVHFSKAMSMTFGNMDAAVKDLLEKYPDRKFYAIDTRCISIGGLNIALEIGDMRNEGKTAEQIVEWAKTGIYKFATYYFADDLKFFKRSGRVGGITATMGTLLGVRPIIYMNADGKMVSIGKERGRVKALERLLAYVDELGEDIDKHRVFIAHADSGDFAEEFISMLTAKYGDKLDIHCLMLNPTAGSHCGPNSMGVCFHAKHR